MNYPDAQINMNANAVGQDIGHAGAEQLAGKGLDTAYREMTPNERERNVLLERLKTLNEDELCNSLRRQLEGIEHSIRSLSRNLPPGERRDQVVLAFRHVEDARMRLGKVIQHGSGGGKSIYT